MKLHGNYCGVGHGDATYTQPAVDEVDQVCKTHDKCYDDKGYLNCKCDYDFIIEMKKIRNINKDLQQKVQLMTSWFENAACQCKKPEGEQYHLPGKASLAQRGACV